MYIEKMPSEVDDNPDPSVPITTWRVEVPGPHVFPWHTHSRHQLVYASEGLMTVRAHDGTWLVPPQQGVWMPAGLEHEVSTGGPLSLRSIYVHTLAGAGLCAQCRVLAVSPLLRALLLKLTEEGEVVGARRRGHLAAVILDELRDADPEPFHLPMPRDPRLRLVADALIGEPGDERGLGVLARGSGASSRTLARGFQRETGMTFGAWRRRLRLMRAVARLAQGEPVTRVAYELGYRSPSAFVAMFRRTLGSPPARYMRGSRGA